MSDLPLLKDIDEAAALIDPLVRATPLVRSRWLSEEIAGDVFLKLECFQNTGSFKIRGGANRLLRLEKGTRVVAVSAGNHARAVAESAEHANLNATIVMPVNASPTKVSALARYRVDLRLEGGDYDAAEAHAIALAERTGAVFVSPYNDFHVIAGQATVATELFDRSGPLDAIVVPAGGGGLIAGVGIVARSRGCSVIGAQPSVASTLAASFRQGKQINVPQGSTIADGLAGNLERNSCTVDAAIEYVQRFITVSEQEIGDAVRMLVDEEHILAEPSAAVAVAAVLSEASSFRGQRTAIIVTGSSIGSERLKWLL